jgi:hypothetical protein
VGIRPGNAEVQVAQVVHEAGGQVRAAVAQQLGASLKAA